MQLMRRATALLLGLIWCLPMADAQELRRATVWNLQLGRPISAQPSAGEFRAFACGSNGGPPRQQLSGWSDLGRCRTEATGLREVYFEYDDEYEYIARARDLAARNLALGRHHRSGLPGGGIGVVRRQRRAQGHPHRDGFAPRAPHRHHRGQSEEARRRLSLGRSDGRASRHRGRARLHATAGGRGRKRGRLTVGQAGLRADRPDAGGHDHPARQSISASPARAA